MLPTIGDYQDASRKYVADHSAIKDASPDDIKAILTYIWRGERFCDGLWAEVIGSGRRNTNSEITGFAALLHFAEAQWKWSGFLIALIK